MTQSNRKMSTATGNKITKAAGKGVEYAKTKKVAVDAMYADGMLPSDCYSPTKKNLASGKSTTNSEDFARLNTFIVAGFSARDKKLLKPATSKGMTDSQKFHRREAGQKIGAIRNDLMSALKRRQGGSGPNATRTPGERVTAHLDGIAKIIENNEMEFEVENFNKVLANARSVIAEGLSE
jgi:hypothetical protein